MTQVRLHLLDRGPASDEREAEKRWRRYADAHLGACPSAECRRWYVLAHRDEKVVVEVSAGAPQRERLTTLEFGIEVTAQRH